MNIMLITPLPPPTGGIASWSKKYIDYLYKNNHNVCIVNTALVGKRRENINNKRSIANEIQRSIRIIKDIIYNQIKYKEIDIIHFNTPCTPLGIIRDYFCSVFINNNHNIVIHCRSNVKDQINGSNIAIFFLKLFLQKASIILVLNNSSMDFVKKLTDKKVYITNNFVNENYILDRTKIIKKEIHKVIFTGHVTKTKGINEILEVAKYYEKIDFHIIGEIAEEYNCIKLPNNVFLEGKKDENYIKQKLDESDVFLFPSYTEGFSNSLAEAMARGLPIIASDVGANKDMIENMGGLIIPPKNIESIIEALKIIQSPILRRKMSAWNINKVKDKYTMNKTMDSLLSIYQETILRRSI